MNQFKSFASSSIGKKFFMATTGILLSLFLIMHLVGNLILFVGADAFNQYVGALSNFKPIVRIIEMLLALIFLNHIIFGTRLTLENRRATPDKYTINSAKDNSTIFSRNMGLSGSIIFIFLMTHLSTIWYRFQVQHDGGNYYNIVMGDTIGFGNPIVTGLYCVAMILLGFHLRHGFQSAFQTFGIRHYKYRSAIETGAVFIWFFIPLGFLSIAVWFGILSGGH